jgi:2-dehydropantoate 2-reductase
MNILIVGAGSIGTYLGCLLEKAGNRVTLLGRTKLKNVPDTILIRDKVYSLPKRIYKLPENENFEVVFITSKLYDLENNLKLIKSKKLGFKYLVSIQNGIVESEVYSKYVADSLFTSISVFEGFRILDNQILINQSEMGWKTDDSPAGLIISTLLKKAGINCSPAPNLESLKAEKTIMNCSVNLLSAIEKKTFFELYETASTRKRMDTLFDESYSVLHKKYSLKSRSNLKGLFHKIISPMRHYSSTYQDAVSGRKTEVGFLNKLIIKLGRNFKVPTPENIKIVKEFEKIYS